MKPDHSSSPRLKVLFVDHSGDPGGGQLGLERYANQPSTLDRRYLFLSSGDVDTRLRKQGVPGVQTLPWGGPGLSAMFRRRGEVNAAIDREAPDLIVANSLRAAVALAIARPSSVTAYYIRQDMTAQSMGTLQRRLANVFVFPFFDGFIANSRWTATTVPRRFRSLVADEPAYPLSGVERLVREVPRSDQRPDASTFEMLWMGRLDRWKGLHVALDAVRELVARGYAVRLTVAGGSVHASTTYADQMRGFADGHGLPVEFVGHVGDIAEALGTCDAVLHTSTRPEPFGQVVVQGMAAGRSVVASDCGGPQEIIRDRLDGLLVPPNDSTALADALAELIGDPALRRGTAQSARNRAREQFSDQELAARFDAIATAIATRG